MSNEKLGFNKRISIVKKAVFDGVITSNELEDIKGTNKVGFYSIATICKHLYPVMNDNDIDLDLVITNTEVVGIWIDCQGDSDKTRSVNVDFSRIANVGKLQLMANEVQSEGAVKSYTRRYALTSILGLPSTDLIDNGGSNSGYKKKTNNSTEPKEDQKKQQVTKEGYMKRIKKILYIVAGEDKEKAIKLLEEESKYSFKDKETGKTVNIKGIQNNTKIEDINIKRLQATYGQIKVKYPEIAQKVKEELDGKK